MRPPYNDDHISNTNNKQHKYINIFRIYRAYASIFYYSYWDVHQHNTPCCVMIEPSRSTQLAARSQLQSYTNYIATVGCWSVSSNGACCVATSLYICCNIIWSNSSSNTECNIDCRLPKLWGTYCDTRSIRKDGERFYNKYNTPRTSLLMMLNECVMKQWLHKYIKL